MEYAREAGDGKWERENIVASPRPPVFARFGEAEVGWSSVFSYLTLNFLILLHRLGALVKVVGIATTEFGTEGREEREGIVESDA